MSVRSALPEDAGAIADIWNEVIRDTLATFTTVEKDVEALARQIAEEPERWWVSGRDGEVLGFACYFQFRSGPGYAQSMEYTIHLARAARGKGYGRLLLAALEEGARDAGVHSLYGGVSGANEGGQRFHEAVGFKPLAVLPEVGRKWRRRLDLHLFHKFL